MHEHICSTFITTVLFHPHLFRAPEGTQKSFSLTRQRRFCKMVHQTTVTAVCSHHTTQIYSTAALPIFYYQNQHCKHWTTTCTFPQRGSTWPQMRDSEAGSWWNHNTITNTETMTNKPAKEDLLPSASFFLSLSAFFSCSLFSSSGSICVLRRATTSAKSFLDLQQEKQMKTD